MVRQARETRRKHAVPLLPRLRTILVPVDGSPAAEHALPYALALARRSGAEVTLLNVYSTLQAANDPELLGWRGGEYVVEPHRDYLDDLAARAAEACTARVRPVLLKGDWPEDAIGRAIDWGADLVVMAARRRGWWSRVWPGSVSGEVARYPRAPVLLVPGRDEPPVLTDEPPLSRLLVPLDGSAPAERALGPAAALAALTNGECDLLRVVSSRPYIVDWSLAYGGRPMVASAEETRAAQQYLRGVVARLRARGVSSQWQVVADERPTAEAITGYAELRGASIIAMASRAGGGLAGLFRGSLAMRVARRAHVPVLFCRTT
jgi:nucleotide-binding universal stress UspA family protein